MLPPELTRLIVTLQSVVTGFPPDLFQLVNTELRFTPLTVFIVQLITRKLPTIAPCMGRDGDMVTAGVGTA